MREIYAAQDHCRIDPADAGRREVGETVKVAYFSQELPEMDDSRRVIDYVKDIGEYIQTTEGRITASQMLERFLFTPDMQYAPLKSFPVGRKRDFFFSGFYSLIRISLCWMNVPMIWIFLR